MFASYSSSAGCTLGDYIYISDSCNRWNRGDGWTESHLHVHREGAVVEPFSQLTMVVIIQGDATIDYFYDN